MDPQISQWYLINCTLTPTLDYSIYHGPVIPQHLQTTDYSMADDGYGHDFTAVLHATHRKWRQQIFISQMTPYTFKLRRE